LRTIVELVVQLEEPLMTLERRGIDLRYLAAKHQTERGLLPRYRVFLGREQHWFIDKAELDKFLAEQETKLGHELRVADDRVGHKLPAAEGAGTNGAAEEIPQKNGHESTLQVVDLHEMRVINQVLQELAGYGI